MLTVDSALNLGFDWSPQDGNTASTVTRVGAQALQAQQDLRRSLEDFQSEQREERKRREQDNLLVAANEEVRSLRRENERLRLELERASLGDSREMKMLKVQPSLDCRN